jgi:hypothetical protein
MRTPVQYAHSIGYVEGFNYEGAQLSRADEAKKLRKYADTLDALARADKKAAKKLRRAEAQRLSTRLLAQQTLKTIVADKNARSASRVEAAAILLDLTTTH